MVPAERRKVLLEELRSLYLLAHEVAVTWVMAQQAAKAARDAELKRGSPASATPRPTSQRSGS